MQIKGKYSWLKHVDFMIVDLIAMFLAFVTAYAIKFGNIFFARDGEWVRYILLVLVLNVVITLFVGPYSGILRRPYYMEVVRALQLTLINLAITSLIFFSFKIGAVYSRELSFFMFGFYFVFSLILKFIWKKLIVSGKIVVRTSKKTPLFVIGSEGNIKKAIRNLMAGDFQLYDIRGVHLIDDASRSSIEIDSFGAIPVIATNYEKYVLDNNIDDVLVAVSPGKLDKEVYNRMNANGIALHMIIEAAIGLQPEDQYIQNFGVYKAVSVNAFSFTPRQMVYLGIKRLFDIIFGLLGLVLLLPITLIVKLSYLFSGDRAKIFYTQERVGQNGKKIHIWKYRTMVPNADKILQELLQDEKYRKEWKENQKFSNDPRITKAGRILRKTSIDELPQLVNVLKGDMSLVGPRPLVQGELEAHNGLKLYQKVKPGITGWWGCNGRSNIDYRERLELEYYYVKHCSLYLDVLCIFRTILAVVKKDGAQ